MVTRALYRLGRKSARRPWIVIAGWLATAALVLGSSALVGRALSDSFDAPGLDSTRATELLTAAGADQSGLTAQVVATPQDPHETFATSADARAALARLQQSVAALPRVLGTSDPSGELATGGAASTAGGAVSPDARVAVIRVQYPVVEKLSRSDLVALERVVTRARAGSPLQIEMGGDLVFTFEEPQTGHGELLGLVAAVLVLLLAFGSVIAMSLPIVIALLSLAIGVGALSLVAYLLDVPTWAPVIGSMVGLGVGIDYALFIVSRHRENLAAGHSIEESVGRALATAGRAVVLAGGTVVIAILGLAVAGIPFLTAGGVAVSLIVLVVVLASVTLLPALLGLAGQRINGRTRLGNRTRVPLSRADWGRWGSHVARHPWPYAVSGIMLLVVLAAPALALRAGIPDDGTRPQDRTERRAYDLVSDGFGPGVNGPLVIAVDITRDDTVLGPLRRAISRDAGIASVAAPVVTPSAEVATLIAYPTTGPQEAATYDTVRRLRADVLPTVLRHSSASAHIGGQTATFADLGGRVADRLPRFVLAVVLLSVVLLALVFRSVAVPVKAAVLNVLSIGASFGVLVAVFQWGWGADLIGLTATVPIVSFIPLFMFAILFGLSMDYEVFLLSRIREEYLVTGDNTRSVVAGIASTGRVITSAALIMVSVFLGFVLDADPTTKMFGLGLATAILVDATVVRLVLVPAVMTLLGDRNWWAPRWLRAPAGSRPPSMPGVDGPIGRPANVTAADLAPARSGDTSS